MGEFLAFGEIAQEMPGLTPALSHGVIPLQHQMLLSSWPQRVTSKQPPQTALGTQRAATGVSPSPRNSLENQLWAHPGPAMGHRWDSWDEVGFWS